MRFASEESLRLSDDNIGTEHIILGLLHDESGDAKEILNERGITLLTARKTVGDVKPPKGLKMLRDRGPYSANTKKIFEVSMNIAAEMGHNFVDPMHFLLAICRTPDCSGFAILSKLLPSIVDFAQGCGARLSRLKQE